MLNRLTVSLTLALLGVIGTVSPTFAAASSPDQDEIMIGMGVLVLGAMALLFVIYAIKHALGLDKMPPATEPQGHDPHAHH
jgi:hypothetical protein